MNCGKTTALLQAAFNYEERGMRVLIIKPKIDTKGSAYIVSRLGARRRADMLTTPDTSILQKMRSLPHRADCIFVDEAQFLEPEHVDELFEIAIQENIPVIAYGLRSDFKTVSFPGSKRLFELAHSLEELKTICRCGKKAIFNGRKKNGVFVFEGSQVAIDGEETIEYESLCGNCYLKFAASA
jgi:thymidine kinase